MAQRKSNRKPMNSKAHTKGRHHQLDSLASKLDHVPPSIAQSIVNHFVGLYRTQIDCTLIKETVRKLGSPEVVVMNCNNDTNNHDLIPMSLAEFKETLGEVYDELTEVVECRKEGETMIVFSLDQIPGIRGSKYGGQGAFNLAPSPSHQEALRLN